VAFGSSNQTVGIAFKGKDEVSPVVRGIRQTMDGFKRDAKQGFGLAAGFSVMRIGMRAIGAVGDAFVGTIQNAAQFEDAMVKSTAIMGDVSEEMRDRMENAARDIAKTTSFSAKEAADSYFFLASAGLDAAESIEALPRVARFAQAGNFDLARATDLLTDAQSALGMSSEDLAVNMRNMTRVSDVLVKANTVANASVEQFSESLTNRAGAALRLVGKDIEEGVALLSAWADQGVKGAEAGTRLDIVLRDLQAAAIKNTSAFDDFGVAVFDSEGEMRNVADIVFDLEMAFGGLSDRAVRAGLSQLGFQSKTVSATASLIGASDKVREYEKELRDAGGTTEEVAEKQLDSLTEKLGLLQSAFDDISLGIGQAFIPILSDAAEAIRLELVPELEQFLALLGTDEMSRFADLTGLAFDEVARAAGASGPEVDALRQTFVDTYVAAKALERGDLPSTFEELRIAAEAAYGELLEGIELEKLTARVWAAWEEDLGDVAEATDWVSTALKRLRENLDEYADVPSIGKLNKSIKTQRRLMLEAAAAGNDAAWARHKHKLVELRDDRDIARWREQDFKAWKRDKREERQAEAELQAARKNKRKQIASLAAEFEVNQKKVKKLLKEEKGDVQAVIDRLTALNKKKAMPKVDIDTTAAHRKLDEIEARGRRLGMQFRADFQGDKEPPLPKVPTRKPKEPHSGGVVAPGETAVIRQNEAVLTPASKTHIVPLDGPHAPRGGGGGNVYLDGYLVGKVLDEQMGRQYGTASRVSNYRRSN
jgi:TP901 family phage tail tape measure protein